jgi:16S rRNA (adenine1518-N6/adenine1519-N6)-dimethyltransferase
LPKNGITFDHRMSLTLKKSLGQHFLINEAVCMDIVEAVTKDEPTRLLEIGPGGGAITKYFVKQTALDFKVVEISGQKISFSKK